MSSAIKPTPELWLEPLSGHGHFHAGEEIVLRAFKGSNMKPMTDCDLSDITAQMRQADGTVAALTLYERHDGWELRGAAAEPGPLQIWVEQRDGGLTLLAKLVAEISDHGDGHRHHHHDHGPTHSHEHHHESGLTHRHAHVHEGEHEHRHEMITPLGLPLELLPLNGADAHLGEYFALQALKDGQPLPGAELKGTYAATRQADYPLRAQCDAEGKASVFLSAPGNILFTVSAGDCVSTLCLLKSV